MKLLFLRHTLAFEVDRDVYDDDIVAFLISSAAASGRACPTIEVSSSKIRAEPWFLDGFYQYIKQAIECEEVSGSYVMMGQDEDASLDVRVLSGMVTVKLAGCESVDLVEAVAVEEWMSFLIDIVLDAAGGATGEGRIFRVGIIDRLCRVLTDYIVRQA